MKKEQLRLYAVTDAGVLKLQSGSLYDAVAEAIEGGVTMVQYREKKLTGNELENSAVNIMRLCRGKNVPFIVNDNVYLAKKIGADGVHLGADDMSVSEARKILGESAIIGATAKTREQAQAAEAAGADYIGSGAIFGTTTKTDARPMDMQTLRGITECVSIPVVAIGGITGYNVIQLKDTGIAGVAVVSGIFAKENVREAVDDLNKKMESVLS